MWISDFAIRNRVVTIVVTLALVLFGATALLLLDTDEFPEVNPPVVSVAIAYPGASPSVVERELVDPLEEAFSSIAGVDEMRSTAMDGFTQIIVIFDFEKDLQEASQDIRDRISEIRQELPPEMEEPILTRFDPNDLPIVSLTLASSRLGQAELTRLADPGVTGALRSVPGVADVKVVGGVEAEMVVELRPDGLEAAGLGVGSIVETLQAENLAAPVGRVTGSLDEKTIRLSGRLQGAEQFGDIVVGRASGTVVRLRDVADVRAGTEEPRTAALYNGAPAVGIDVIKSSGDSTTAVSDGVRGRLDEIRGSLPEGVELRVVRDAGVRVARSVADVEESLLEGALLTVLVVFVFLRSWRSTVITGLALPVSVLASFIAVWAFGFTLNTMSLLGLSLAIGILIDDAIVVRENIVRHMEMGKDHVQAAREGTAEIGLAVAATTFSIVVVFVPIAMMGGVAEQWFAPFALTIAASVLVSLLVSFSLDPMLSSVWRDPEAAGTRRTWVARRLAGFDRGFDRLTRRYEGVIGWALRHRLAMVLIAVVSFGGALAMPGVGLVGSEFFPIQDRSEFEMVIETPPGSNVEYTRSKVLEATRLAASLPEVTYTYATVGGEGGNVDVGSVYVRLVPRDQRDRRQERVAEELRDRVARIGGITVALATAGFRAEKQIQVRLSGPDLEVLDGLAKRVAAEVAAVPGAVDVGLSTKGTKPELEVQVDREVASRAGVTVGQIAGSLRAAFAGIDAGDWIDPDGETRDVTVRLSPEARVRAADLARLPLVVVTPGEPPVTLTLGDVARVSGGTGPTQISHIDRRRTVTVGANTEGRPLSEVVGGIEARLAHLARPPGYAASHGGETEDQQEVFGRILVALGVAIALMYLILVVQFGSFLDPIPIMASLPLSLIGVMLALVVTGSTLNIMSMIGVILLMGIVAKNAILLIDFAKWARARGLTRQQAIVEAGGTRLRPIVMTSLAIIAGMLPVAIGGGEGGDFRAPLGRAVIGGVITSTLLTLLVIPTFYDIIAGWREAVMARLRRRRAHTPADPGPEPTAQ